MSSSLSEDSSALNTHLLVVFFRLAMGISSSDEPGDGKEEKNLSRDI